MKDWADVQLDEVIAIKHGFAFKGEHFVNYLTDDVLVTPGNFAIGGGFQLGKVKSYDGPIPAGYVLSPGDIVTTMTDLSKKADTLGYSAKIPKSKYRFLHNQRIGKVILKDRSVDLAFIAWLMRTDGYRHQIVGSATGSTVKHTSPGRILSYRFKLPPSAEQRRISDVLSALDDKIDFNRWMNETLEESARALFRDWFVDFGPTRAKAEGRPAYLAPDLWSLFPDRLEDDGVPEGWTLGTLGNIAQSVDWKVEPSKIDSDTPYIGLEHMPRRSVALADWEGAGKVSSAKSGFKTGQILFGKLRPYFHKVGLAPLDGICSTDIVVMEAKQERHAAMLLACVSSDDFVAFADQSSTGTKMPRTSWPMMSRYPLPIPAPALADRFQSVAAPMLEQIMANIHASRILAATRDTLLPKLMSGELRVRDAEALAA